MSFYTGAASNALAVAAIVVSAVPAAAQSTPRASFDLPAQDLETSLRTVARMSGKQIIIASAVTQGRKAPALKGQYSGEEAIRFLLQGTDIHATFANDTILIGEELRAEANDAADSDPTMITVTGSRIRGAPLASPQITVGREDILRAGYGDLGEALRALPQNFGGGQNPGLGIGAVGGGITNVNVTGGSSIDLRGLGADATLTLLNGHRLSFGGLAQGVDISSIPIDAIERIEIVPDGASALYGSDAVAGVVNVILRNSLDGLSLRTRLGTSTDGGGFSQQYQAAFGQQWNSGSLVAAYGFRQDKKVDAADRDFSASLGKPYPLIPGQSNHSLTLSVTQAVADRVSLSLDATYNRRKFSSDLLAFGVLQHTDTKDETFAIAPTLSVSIGSAWRFSATGVYGETSTDNFTSGFSGETELYADGLCYCHRIYGIEGYIEGPVIAIPGGDIRAVLGGGFRSNRYLSVGKTTKYGGSEKDRFLYGELSIPLISERNATPWAHGLRITAAGRYDSYKLAGDVATPRFGLVYSPSRDVDFKLSWGRSFKAPKLLDQFERPGGILLPTAFFVGADAPPGSTALTLAGGSRELRPERATTASWSIDFHPVSMPGFSLEATLFSIRYRDRVLAPIGNYADALSPAYSDVVIRNPAADQVSEALAGTEFFFNSSGETFDPGRVAYLIDNYVRNVASQKINGMDISVSYSATLGEGEIATNVGGSWIESEQKSSPQTPYFDLAGTAWHPPHLRMRGSWGWSNANVELNAYANFIGGIQDRRSSPYRDGNAMTTIDLSAGYTFASGESWLDGLKAQFTVNNLFNKRPPYLQPAAFAEPYDSTNYSPLGRFVAISLSRTL